MLVEQRLQQLGDRAPSLVAPHEHHRLPRVVVERANAIVFGRLGRGVHHHLLARWTPPGTPRRQPTHVALVGVGEDRVRCEAVARIVNRLFFPAYSGSGLLMVCCGRLSTMSPAFRRRRPVSTPTPLPASPPT